MTMLMKRYSFSTVRHFIFYNCHSFIVIFNTEGCIESLLNAPTLGKETGICVSTNILICFARLCLRFTTQRGVPRSVEKEITRKFIIRSFSLILERNEVTKKSNLHHLKQSMHKFTSSLKNSFNFIGRQSLLDQQSFGQSFMSVCILL